MNGLKFLMLIVTTMLVQPSTFTLYFVIYFFLIIHPTKQISHLISAGHRVVGGCSCNFRFAIKVLKQAVHYGKVEKGKKKRELSIKLISSIEMEKGIVLVVLVVMAAAAAICPPLVGGVVIEQAGETATKTAEDPPLIGGVFVEQAGEEAAKTAGEGLGDIARRAIHKADKIWNGSSNIAGHALLMILFSLFAYFASACY